MNIRRLFVLIALPLLFVGMVWFTSLAPNSAAEGLTRQVSYTELMEHIASRDVTSAHFNDQATVVEVTTKDEGTLVASIGPRSEKVQNALETGGVPIQYDAPPSEDGNWLVMIINLLIPFALLFGVFFLFRGGAGGGGGGAFNFGKSQPQVQLDPSTDVTFDDVAGVDEAKEELEEVVTFLKTPGQFTDVGAKIPKGVLLVGAPGTGKTLLAKAVAGEAGVPFFSISGSEFVEMFVGVGASRVRDLFKRAKENAPCIVFIDEIDAVGRQRGAGIGNTNDEREQTLNQLLTELDGFQGNTGVIVIAATNQPEVLDKALVRAGRFDRQVTVDRPDYAGRVAILAVHSRDKKFEEGVELEEVARRVPGFTGADLANLLNEAAILAGRRKKEAISQLEISDAIDRVIGGAEKRGKTIAPRVKRLVAYHEAGHAIASALYPDYEPVEKISIVPRGGAGGLTWFSPLQERVDAGMYTKGYFLSEIRVALAGRIAEEIVFGDNDITNGASSDLKRVYVRASQLVTEFGMDEVVGPIGIGGQAGGQFVGATGMGARPYSEALGALVDSQVSELVKKLYDETKAKLVEKRKVLDELAGLLLEKETVNKDEFLQLLEKYDISAPGSGFRAE